MQKLKVYLDTSVISHLIQEDVPEKVADTQKLWEMFRQNKFDVYLSTVTLREIQDCLEPRRGKLIGKWRRKMIAKPKISPNFTIDDIHKIREYHYELTKDMTRQERQNFYNESGRKFLNEMQKEKNICSLNLKKN